MKIVLVGGAGLIGHNAAIALKERNHEVTIIDSLMVNNYYALQGNRRYLGFIEERLDLLDYHAIPVLRLDARDYHMMNLAINPLKPDCIVHLAAVAHINRANKDPFNTFDHNLRTLENVLDIAVSQKVPHFVFFSSSTAYGDFKKPVIDETEPCEPMGIYGSLKYAGELITRAYGDVCGVPWTIIRPCALYGPRCVSGRVTQKFIEQALAGQPITIDGDGGGKHDFTYIGDLVQGLIRVVESNIRNEAFNITSGQARSVQELADIVVSRFPTEIIYGEPDPEKPSRGTMSVDKARNLLGYVPQYTLEEGMNEYMDWYAESPSHITTDVQ